jgi:hypothetical protein
MTREEINEMFPPSYSGNAQISDIRLALTYLVKEDGPLSGIEFHEVATLNDMYLIQELGNGDLCKVADIGNGASQTYIWDVDAWKVLVESSSGGGGNNYIKTTQNFTITATQAGNEEIDLDYIPVGSQHISVYVNGMYQMQGTNYDWTLSGSTVKFIPERISAGDHVAVKYSH